MGAVVAASITVGFVFFATVLSLAAYHSGVNVFAWSQRRAMRELGYDWLTPEPRYQSMSGDIAPRMICQNKEDGLWYARAWASGQRKPWFSGIGFDNPIAAHTYAEVQGWRAQ